MTRLCALCLWGGREGERGGWREEEGRWGKEGERGRDESILEGDEGWREGGRERGGKREGEREGILLVYLFNLLGLFVFFFLSLYSKRNVIWKIIRFQKHIRSLSVYLSMLICLDK